MKKCWWKPLWTTLDNFGQLWTIFDFAENYFWMETNFNWWKQLWTTLDHFVLMKTTLDNFGQLWTIFWWRPKITDYVLRRTSCLVMNKSETILYHFGQLWTSLQILIKSQKLSSMTTTLPANSNQLFVGVGENVNYQLTINYLLLTINYQLINY